MSSHLTLKIIETSRVAPPPGTTPVCATLPFTFYDVFWIVLPPVERLFFYPYRHQTTDFISSLLPSLKSSLSTALQTYYPLAGGYRRVPGSDEKIEHYYVEGDAVTFIVAECDGKFDELACDHERGVMPLYCLAPELPKSDELQPLFALQVTVFPSQGIVIGTTVHHAACDGSSSMQFMHSWAETCQLGAPVSSRVPVFDRTLIPDPSNLYSFYYKQVHGILTSAVKGNKPTSEPSELLVATFTLNTEHIQRLKRLVSAKAQERKTAFRCSTVVVTFAYAWIGFVRAKNIDSTKKLCLTIPADFRARMQPPLPAEYFGNCIGSCLPTAQVADLLQDDGIVIAAENIGKAVDKLGDRLKVARNWIDEYTGFAGTPILSVAGSPKFKVYDVDFGFGKPTKVEMVSAAKTGAMAVAESRDGQGGVELSFAFTKDEMAIFKKYFFEGLKLLCE